MQLHNFSPQKQQNEGGGGRLYGLMKLSYTDSTRFTLKQIRAALAPSERPQKFHAALQEPVSQEFTQWETACRDEGQEGE